MRLLLVLVTIFSICSAYRIKVSPEVGASTTEEEARIYLSFCADNEIHFCGTASPDEVDVFQNCTTIYDISLGGTYDAAHEAGIIQTQEARYYCIPSRPNSYILLATGLNSDSIGIDELDLSPIGPAVVTNFCDAMAPACDDVNAVFTQSGNCNNLSWNGFVSTDGFWLEGNPTAASCLVMFQEFDPLSDEALLFGGLECQSGCPGVDTNPPNGLCISPISLVSGISIPTSNLNVPSSTFTDCSGSVTEDTVWFSFRLESESDEENIEIKAESDTGAPVELVVFSGSCGSLNCIQHSPPVQNPSFPYARIVLDGSVSLNTDVLIAAYVSADTGTFKVTATRVPAPENESCTDAIEIFADISSPVVRSNSFSVNSITDCASEVTGPVVFYRFVTQFPNSQIDITTCGFPQEIQPVYSIFIDSCFAAGCLDTINDPDCNIPTSNPYVVRDQPSGTELNIAVYDDNFGEGEFSLKVQELGQFIGECGGATRLRNRVQIPGTTEGASATWDLLRSCGGNPVTASPSAFYVYTTETSFGDLTISTCFGNELDTYITLFSGSCSALTCRGENNDACGQDARITLAEDERLPFGTDLYIVVHSPDTSAGAFNIVVEETEIIVPSNGECVNADQLFNNQFVAGSTDNSPTLRNSVELCDVPATNDSPTVFYYYFTEFNYGDITVDSCDGTAFDSYLSVFVGDCDTLQCIGTNDNACGSSARVTLAADERQIRGTRLTIAVHGSGSDFGFFGLTVSEIGVNEPSNGNCFNPITIQAGETIFDSNFGSAVLSSAVEPCVTATGVGSPVVFYRYVVQANDSSITIDTCLGASFDTVLQVFTGTCDGAQQCVGIDNGECGNLGSVSVSGVNAGTELFIAVHGVDSEVGRFVLRVNEDFECDPNGPEYECSLSFALKTDQKCGNDEQCATIPSFDLGYCYDRGTDCNCSISQTSGVQPGDEVTAGLYEVHSVAINDGGFSSDLCSFRINVLNTCNPVGPEVLCRTDPIRLFTTASCSLDGTRCAKMKDSFLGTCRDFTECSCSVSQLSGPIPGEKLLPGAYFIELTATNDVGYSSSKPCQVKVEVS